MNSIARITLKAARRFSVALIGGTVLLIGVIMLVTPGPALLVIPAGLAILAIEFRFAAVWLGRLKSAGKRVSEGLRSRDQSDEVR